MIRFVRGSWLKKPLKYRLLIGCCGISTSQRVVHGAEPCNKTDHNTWKAMNKCGQKIIYFLCAILLQVICAILKVGIFWQSKANKTKLYWCSDLNLVPGQVGVMGGVDPIMGEGSGHILTDPTVTSFRIEYWVLFGEEPVEELRLGEIGLINVSVRPQERPNLAGHVSVGQTTHILRTS